MYKYIIWIFIVFIILYFFWYQKEIINLFNSWYVYLILTTPILLNILWYKIIKKSNYWDWMFLIWFVLSLLVTWIILFTILWYITKNESNNLHNDIKSKSTQRDLIMKDFINWKMNKSEYDKKINELYNIAK
jgi:uncharacterized membrane protein